MKENKETVALICILSVALGLGYGINWITHRNSSYISQSQCEKEIHNMHIKTWAKGLANTTYAVRHTLYKTACGTKRCDDIVRKSNIMHKDHTELTESADGAIWACVVNGGFRSCSIVGKNRDFSINKWANHYTIHRGSND